MRTVVAVVLTLVAVWSAQVANASARSGLMALCADEPVSCCCGGHGDGEAPIQGEQRIESTCGCTVEPAPRSNPPAAHACMAQSSIRVASVHWVKQASVEPSLLAPRAPSRAWIEMDRLRATPLPGRALVAQKIALLV